MTTLREHIVELQDAVRSDDTTIKTAESRVREIEYAIRELQYLKHEVEFKAIASLAESGKYECLRVNWTMVRRHLS